MQSTMQDAVERLRRFVDEDRDLVWTGDMSYEQHRPVQQAQDSFGRPIHTVAGTLSTTMSLKLAFVSHDLTAIEEMGEAIKRH